MAAEPFDVDVVVAVHAATKPIARAAASVVEHNRVLARVTIVAHTSIQP